MSYQEQGRVLPGQPPQGSSGEATASLILGICGLLICSLIVCCLVIMYGSGGRVGSIVVSVGCSGGDGQANGWY